MLLNCNLTVFKDCDIIKKNEKGVLKMGRKKIPINRTNFRREFFQLLAQQSLTQCEYKCLLILAEGEEQTKTNVAAILHDSKQHIGKAMLHLEDLGIIKCIRVEGRNAFFSLNLDWKPDECDKNQLKLPCEKTE